MDGQKPEKARDPARRGASDERYNSPGEGRGSGKQIDMGSRTEDVRKGSPPKDRTGDGRTLIGPIEHLSLEDEGAAGGLKPTPQPRTKRPGVNNLDRPPSARDDYSGPVAGDRDRSDGSSNRETLRRLADSSEDRTDDDGISNKGSTVGDKTRHALNVEHYRSDAESYVSYEDNESVKSYRTTSDRGRDEGYGGRYEREKEDGYDVRGGYGSLSSEEDRRDGGDYRGSGSRYSGSRWGRNDDRGDDDKWSRLGRDRQNDGKKYSPKDGGRQPASGRTGGGNAWASRQTDGSGRSRDFDADRQDYDIRKLDRRDRDDERDDRQGYRGASARDLERGIGGYRGASGGGRGWPQQDRGSYRGRGTRGRGGRGSYRGRGRGRTNDDFTVKLPPGDYLMFTRYKQGYTFKFHKDIVFDRAMSHDDKVVIKPYDGMCMPHHQTLEKSIACLEDEEQGVGSYLDEGESAKETFISNMLSTFNRMEASYKESEDGKLIMRVRFGTFYLINNPGAERLMIQNLHRLLMTDRGGSSRDSVRSCFMPQTVDVEAARRQVEKLGLYPKEEREKVRWIVHVTVLDRPSVRVGIELDEDLEFHSFQWPDKNWSHNEVLRWRHKDIRFALESRQVFKDISEIDEREASELIEFLVNRSGDLIRVSGDMVTVTPSWRDRVTYIRKRSYRSYVESQRQETQLPAGVKVHLGSTTEYTSPNPETGVMVQSSMSEMTIKPQLPERQPWRRQPGVEAVREEWRTFLTKLWDFAFRFGSLPTTS